VYVIRNVFRAKPGKSNALAEKFRRFNEALPQDIGIKPSRIMVDASAGFWTVVTEDETEDIAEFLTLVERMSQLEAAKHLDGYHDLVESGYREILRVV